jgi:hypothetical protein
VQNSGNQSGRFYRPAGSLFYSKKEQDDIFLFIRRYTTINDTRFRVVECAGRCSVSGESGKQFTLFLALCGLLFKAEVLSLVDTFIDSGNILDSMISGEVLPPAALRKYKNPSTILTENIPKGSGALKKGSLSLIRIIL